MNQKESRKYLLPQLAALSAINNFELLKEYILKAREANISFTKMYECLLQNYLFAGFPTALTSLKILKEIYPKKSLPEIEDMNLYNFRNKGEINCRKVYGEKFEKLISNINNFSPELSEWLVLEGYGKVLGRPGLSFKERELCVIAVLTVLRFEDQLYSHINGAVRAKASIEEIEKVVRNLDLLTRKKYSAFGIKVLTKYWRNRGMQ